MNFTFFTCPKTNPQPRIDSTQFFRYFGPVIHTSSASRPDGAGGADLHGVMVETFCGWKRFLVPVTNTPPPGFDKANTVEGPWLAKYLEICDADTTVDFDPKLDVVIGSCNEVPVQCRPTYRVLKAALPAILHMTEPFDDRRHPYYDALANPVPRTAYQFFTTPSGCNLLPETTGWRSSEGFRVVKSG